MAAVLSSDDATAALAALRTAPPPPPDPTTDPTTGYTVVPGGNTPDPEMLRQQQLAQQVEEARRNLLLQGADTNLGAPVTVRTAVSATDDPASRLKTLQGYYPDATALPGTDNFVYTDPTGKRMTYAPMGWRMPTAGDIASLGPSAAELVGGVGGGIGGGLAGGPVGAAAGAGIGAASAGEGYRYLIHSLLDTSDLRPPEQIARDAGVTAAVNAVAPAVGDYVVAPVVKGAVNALRYGDTAVTAAARELDASGVAPGLPDKLPAGVATGSRNIQRIESGVSQLPLGGTPAMLGGQTRAAIGDGVSTLSDRAADVAPGAIRPNPETFSTNVNDIANDIGSDWSTTRQALDDHVVDLVGADTPVTVARLQGLRNTMVGQQNQAPLTMAPRYGPAIDRLDGLLTDAGGQDGTLPFDVMRNARTDIGKEIDFAPRGTMPATGQPQLQQVYGALKDKLADAAGSAGPDAADALAAHDAAVVGWNSPGGGAETVKALSNPKLSSDALLGLSKSTSPQAQAQLNTLLSNADPGQRATLVSGVIGQLGLDQQGNFSVAKFLKDWGGMSDVAKGMLFTGDHAPLAGSLDNLATVGKGVVDAATTQGHSNTAAVWAVLNAISSAGGYLAAGEPGLAGGALAANIGAPWGVGRLLESRPFVNWLTTTMADPSAQAWGRSVARLGAVGEADPRLKGFATQLQRRMMSEPPAQ